jgi:S1-C subfamily serine protease
MKADMKWSRNALAVLLFTAVAFAREGGVLSAAKETEINRQMADAGNAATVGIYCKRGKHETYFGTGAVISADGHIVTSTTVVPEGATEIKVYFTNHHRRAAALVEVNKELETSLLKVDATGLPCLALATTLPKVGEQAYTLGNANNMILLGEQASFSAGIVSGLYAVKSADTQSSYAGLAIETDAAINPGQDGGPLLNNAGQLAGIISLSYSKARWQGLAIPMIKVIDGLRALKEKRVSFSTKPMLTPPDEDTATSTRLARAARKIGQSVVSLQIVRQYPAEDLPIISAVKLLEEVRNFDELPPEQQVRLNAEFGIAEHIFTANRQFRRPEAPVTGLLISADGFVLTSRFNLMDDVAFLHGAGVRKIEYKTGRLQEVIQDSRSGTRQTVNPVKSVEVTLADGRRLPARIVAHHLPLEITLLKIEGEALPFFNLQENATSPKIGEPVGVLGVVAGEVPFTLNAGIVSAETRSRGNQFQFDALINYGNSGGPVITTDGKICGVAIQAMSPGPEMGRLLSDQELGRWGVTLNGGLGFGARIDRILEALPALQQGKDVKNTKEPILGVSPNPADLNSDKVLIGDIGSKTPAERAGFRRGDQILAINGQNLNSWKQLFEILGAHLPGDEVTVKLRRKGGLRYLQINDRRIENSDQFQSLLKDLKSGQELNASFVSSGGDDFDVKVKLEEPRQ